MIPFIDLTRQHAALRDELGAAVARVLDSSQFVLGAEGKALERELATLSGVRWALGVGSGTDALRLALRESPALRCLYELIVVHRHRHDRHGLRAQVDEHQVDRPGRLF